MKSMIMEQMRKHTEIISQWMKGDQAAVDFILEINRIIHVWDDLIDQDNYLTPTDINDAFWSLFFILPANRFYINHFQKLNPVLAVAEINWRVSNTLEASGNKKDHEIAYIIRSSYADVIAMSAMIIGGREWAYEVTPDIRRWVHAEGFKKYSSEFEIKGEK